MEERQDKNILVLSFESQEGFVDFFVTDIVHIHNMAIQNFFSSLKNQNKELVAHVRLSEQILEQI
jgi:hypothetical protein